MGKCTALYIHIPFCIQKCFYCDFPSFSGKEDLMLQYAKALSKDIDSIGDKKITSIFIGGGTPTYLSLDAWKIIKNSIKKLNKKPNLEFTIEGNPGTFSEDKLRLFKDIGVNRLSIGLQAAQDILLKNLGRIHTVKQFEESYSMAKKLGYNNINVDLMFGLPNQSLEQWIDTLEFAIKLNPQHISCYSLIVEEGTKFYEIYENDKLKLPPEDIEREMYEYAIKILKKFGYYQYEISNFAKIGKACKHNIVYWSLDDYIGCGAGAHSYINKIRYKNEHSIENYINKINSNGNAVIEKHNNTLKDDIEEFMFMGLRKTNGISISEFNGRFHISIKRIYKDVIKKYLHQGLLIKNKDRLYLSPKGIEISNIVMADFIL